MCLCRIQKSQPCLLWRITWNIRWENHSDYFAHCQKIFTKKTRKKKKMKKKKKINWHDWVSHAEPSQAAKYFLFSSELFFFLLWGINSDLLSVWFKADIWLRPSIFSLKYETSFRALSTVIPSKSDNPTFLLRILQSNEPERQNYLSAPRLELPGAQHSGLGFLCYWMLKYEGAMQQHGRVNWECWPTCRPGVQVLFSKVRWFWLPQQRTGVSRCLVFSESSKHWHCAEGINTLPITLDLLQLETIQSGWSRVRIPFLAAKPTFGYQFPHFSMSLQEYPSEQR